MVKPKTNYIIFIGTFYISLFYFKETITKEQFKALINTFKTKDATKKVGIREPNQQEFCDI